MAMRVVDCLEAVEIEHEHSHLSSVAVYPDDGALDAITEQAAVGEPGQGIVLGQIAHPLLAALALGNVVDDRDVPLDLAGVISDRANRLFDDVNRSVLSAIDDFALPPAIGGAGFEYRPEERTVVLAGA